MKSEFSWAKHSWSIALERKDSSVGNKTIKEAQKTHPQLYSSNPVHCTRSRWFSERSVQPILQWQLTHRAKRRMSSCKSSSDTAWRHCCDFWHWSPQTLPESSHMVQFGKKRVVCALAIFHKLTRPSKAVLSCRKHSARVLDGRYQHGISQRLCVSESLFDTASHRSSKSPSNSICCKLVWELSECSFGQQWWACWNLSNESPSETLRVL